MIKQTRGALTMLLSVYRSVLKNAYLKNFAAVALAASVGVASAATDPVITGYESNAADAKDVAVTTETNAITAGDTADAIAYAKKVTVAKASGSEEAVTLTIKGNSTNSATLNATNVVIGDKGTVSLVGDTKGANIAGPVSIDGESAKLDFTSGTTSVGDVTLTKGSVTVTDGVATVNSLSSAKDGSVTVASGKTLNVKEGGLLLEDDATLSNTGNILVSGTATIGKITATKLGNMTFGGDANIALDTIKEDGVLTFKKNGTFAGNVTNNGSITLDKEANVSVNGVGGLTNNKTLTVAADADVALTGKLIKNSSTGTITVTEGSEAGKTTKATFTSDVENAGTITLGDRSDVTFAGALTNSKAVTSAGNLTVTGKLTNDAGAGDASSSTITLAKATLGEVDNAKGKITVSSKGNANFTGKLENKSDGTVEVLAGDSTTKTVASFANVVNAGTITLGADSDVSFAKLDNEGTLNSSTDLDLAGKLTNTKTGTVNVKVGTLKASLKDLGLAETGSQAQANVSSGATLEIGDATIEQGIFASSSATAGKIYNDGTIKAGNLTVTDDSDVTLANAGTLSVDSLSIKKNLTSSAALTVAKSISTTGENATLGGTVNLENDGKSEGFLSGFKTATLNAVKGLWNLGGVNITNATIGDAGAGAKASTVTGIGEITVATIQNASVKANTVKAATIGNGSTVKATTVNAAILTGKSVLNADKIDATATTGGAITLDKSTLNVGSVTVAAGSAGDAAIKASNGSTVKITGEYKAVANGLVANLAGSTLELNANNKKTEAGIETIIGDATSTLVINGVKGDVKVVKDTDLTAPVADAENATVRTLAGVYHSIGIKSGSGHYEGIIKGLTYDTNIEELRDGKISKTDIAQYSTVASSTDAFATAQVTAAGTVDKVLNVGSLEVASSESESAINADVTLNKAAANGNFISVKDKTGKEAIAGAVIASGKTLTLNGDGTIGAISGADATGTLVANGNKITAGNIGVSGTHLGTLEVKSGELTAKAVYADTTKVEGNLVADSLTAATSATINGGLTLKKDDDVSTSGILTANTALTTGKNAVVDVESISATGGATLSGKVDVKDTLTVGALNVGAVDSLGNVTTKKLSASGLVDVKAGSLSVTGDTATTLSAGLTVGKAGSVSFAKNVTLGDDSTVEGILSAETLTTTSSKKLAVNNGGKVNVTELAGAADITVGKDGVSNGTGSIYAKTLKAEGTIFIDPDFGQQAAFVGAENLNTVGGIEETTGNIIVGKNAALAVGVSSVDQARSVLSSLGLTDANGSFKQNGVENAIYTDALVKLKNTAGLVVDSQANTTTPPTPTAGQISLADKSAVVIGKNAAAKSVKTGSAVLTADNAGFGVVLANSTAKAKVIFAGNPTKQDIKDVKVFGNAGASDKVISVNDAANVSVQISPLYNEAKLTADGGITDITVNRGYINTALYNASLPVKNMVAEVADTALTGDGVGSDFIMENALVDGGANIESAARLATFGGAYQAAAAAVNTGIDAAQARLGLGIDNSAEVKGENVSVWANAVYKNTESDSFETQGATYGADLDLTSLVIGADYGIAEGSKIGAYASFGTGDVDGKGAGHNVKNDVDTYGFGIYGSTKLASGVSILSDVGYTVAQNEFKGIVSADADMKVFTAGANVKYTFNTHIADITPFVGARYTSFNLESYAVKSAKGIVANTDADTAHIFSIPVGFDLSKQIAAGEWNVKPALTAKVTFNTGDKTVSSSTQFTGVKNALNLDAEVMDDVTYSVGASVSATKGAATFGAGLSYTGSSETNELSAQVGARYTF